MKLAIDFRLAITSLKSTKLRTGLTIIAIVVGVMAYVLVTAFIEGFKTTVATQINEFGGNLVTVNPCRSVERDETGNIISTDFYKSFLCPFGLTEKDLEKLREIEGVKAAAPFVLLDAQVLRDDVPVERYVLTATSEDYPEAFNQKIRMGRFFQDDDSTDKFAIIGDGLSQTLFNSGGLGAQLMIRGEGYTVIGIMDKYPMSFTGPIDIDRAIFIPLEAGKRINNGVIDFMEIDVQLETEVDASEFIKTATAVLKENYGGEEAFTLLTQDESIGILDDILGQIKTVSHVLAYVMLFVGGTVIALIMLIVVKERTREIGIRKSIGATNQNILSQFIIEAIVLSWLGSLVGILIAFVLGLVIGNLTGIQPSYTIDGLLAVVIISTLVGSVFGIIPAAIAARKDPVAALRDE